MIQRNIKGGIVQASVRYARANNKSLGTLYDLRKPNSYILYVNANNLYEWAMSQPMPNDKIQWLNEQECRESELKLSKKQTHDQFFEYHAISQEEYACLKQEYEQTDVISDKIVAFEIKIPFNESPRHFIIEVGMEYLNDLHEWDVDYPMAPELMSITLETTGPKQHEIIAKYFAAACPYSRKLICSFLPKKRYVVFGHMLRFYLDRGMKLIKMHRGIKFTATHYLAEYIENNNNNSNQFKKDDVEKNYYKLMNNSPYKTTIESAARR